MSEEWGPWVEHDGAEPQIARRCVLKVVYDANGTCPSAGEPIGSMNPCWYWRWKPVRVGWFRTELRRVCDNPQYAPIIRYRIRKPRGMAILESIVRDVKAPTRQTEDA